MKQQKKKAAVTPGQSGRITLTHVVFIAVGMLVALLLQALFWPGRGVFASPGAAESTSGAAAAQPAPWGRLEYVPIALDRPEEHFKNFDQEIGKGMKPLWVFRNHTEQQLASLLGTLELNESARAFLGNRTHWEFLPHAIRIAPPPEIVFGLDPATRQRLYALLAANPENVPYAMPFRFRQGGFGDWFADCGLSKAKLDLARSLTYTQENSLCFADAAAFSQVSTPDETKCLVKSLWRVPTFVMKLHIDSKTDVKALLSYWDAFGSARAYKPLIESMARVPEGSSLNVSYLLPSFARLRLYTYPSPRSPRLLNEDCFWTAMNFFNPKPDDSFFNPDQTQRSLRADYIRVRDSSKKFGDVFLLVGRNMEALHMCVYIADNVVFTKNGANPQQPWVFMKEKEMFGEYESNRPYEVQVFRRKTPPPLSSNHQLSAVGRML